MKSKVLLIILFLSLSANIFANELTILSFNVNGHGNNSSLHDFSNEEWNKQIAAVIKKSGASIVLLQEVRLRSEKSILPLCMLLGENWKSVTSVEYSTCPSFGLNNAVLYDDNVVSLHLDHARKLNFYLFCEQYNWIDEDCRKYRFDQNNEQILEFAFSKNSSQTFYVVNIHAPGPDRKTDLDKEKKQLENLYRDFKRKPIIIGGDFNMHRKEVASSSSFSDGIVDGDSGIYENFNYGFQKTTISTSSSRGIDLCNDYDHFIISKNKLFTISEQMHHVFSKRKKENYDVIKIGGTSYTNSSDYHIGISDHLPIMIKLKFN